MYARTTDLQANPAKIEDGITVVREELLPAAIAMDGCVGMSMLVDRESGRCLITTAWESESAMRDSADEVRVLRDLLGQCLGSMGSEVDLWQVAVVHRDHRAPVGACARMMALRVVSDTAGRAKDVFNLVVLPRVQDLTGFCSASMLINPEAGRAVATVTFDSRAALDDSSEAATRICETASWGFGAAVDELVEMDIAVARLHLPEMA